MGNVVSENALERAGLLLEDHELKRCEESPATTSCMDHELKRCEESPATTSCLDAIFGLKGKQECPRLETTLTPAEKLSLRISHGRQTLSTDACEVSDWATERDEPCSPLSDSEEFEFVPAQRGAWGNHSGTYADLPEEIVADVFSFMTVQEHFSIIMRLNNNCKEFLDSAGIDAWPRVLQINEDRKGVVTLCGAAGRRLPVPDRVLSRLGRLGFERIDGCGPRSLRLLANPFSKRMSCMGIALTPLAMAPLAGMTNLLELTIQYAKGAREGAAVDLRELKGLSLQKLSIMEDSHWVLQMPILLNENSLSALATLSSLKSLSLHLHARHENQGRFEAVMPAKLPMLEDLSIKYQELSDLCCTFLRCAYPRLRTLELVGQNIVGWGLSALHGLPLTELNLNHTGMVNEHLARLAGLPIRKLDLTICGGVSGEGMEALKASNIPLTDLNLSYTMVANTGLEALRGMRVKRLNLTGCQIGAEGLGALAQAQLPLDELNLSYTQVDNAALQHLASVPIKRIVVRGTEVTQDRLIALS